VPTKVSDIRANLNENIRHAANAIGKSNARRKVFEEVYRGKQAVKTVEEISKATGLTRMRVLQEAKVLVGNQVIEQTKKDGDTAYRKDEAYSPHKKRILALVADPKKAAKYPTKQAPNIGSTSVVYKVTVRGKGPIAEYITIDDIESFSAVRKIMSVNPRIKLSAVKERDIKEAFQKIIGESFGFDDWGGERNDLFTTKLKHKGKRCKTAFAFKGRATQGVLTPKKMGKNGDQIPRLGGSPAEIYIVVYHSKIDESIIEQLKAAALVSAMSGKKIYYCTIDGDDLNRLCQAYPKAFIF
jgi:hypothetical protein